MSEKSPKKVFNPLLKASVTGATLEEFTQNAILYPVLEIATTNLEQISLNNNASIQDTATDITTSGHELNPSLSNPQLLTPIYQQQQFSNATSVYDNRNQQQQQLPIFYQPENQQSLSDISLLSSFSNENKEEVKSNFVNPVPLFPVNQQVTSFANHSSAESLSTSQEISFPSSGPTELNALPPTSSQGSVNSYRRLGQKRLAYAPVPGLSANRSTPVLTHDQNSSTLQPESVNSFSTNSNLSAVNPSILIPSCDLNEIQSLDCSSSNYFPPAMSKTIGKDSSTLSASIAASSSRNPISVNEDPSTKNSAPYRPVYHHWFHRKEIEGRVIWQPFSMVDSLALEAAFVSTEPERIVATDGGRYDVNILRRQRTSVYWDSVPTEVRRCSWFYKGQNDGRFTPYEENIATKLEEEYKIAYELNQWSRKVEIPNGEIVVFHAPDSLALFPQSSTPDVWNNTTQSAARPRIVKRGMDEFDIDEGEPMKIDHLLFLVHGIGSVCDLKFRTVEEVVDEFRSISMQLVQSHYKSSCDQGAANRIEVLPISWHNKLHSEDTGIDKKLKSITLESIPRLRDFTNDTLLDILFYTSPIYCQTIISTVGNELNRIYELFKKRNPGFKGSVSLGGHSLGSLILFDILCHQHSNDNENSNEGNEDVVSSMKIVKKPHPSERKLNRRISYMMGAVGTGQPQLIYPHLAFHPIAFFALGSPIGMFVTVRGLESLGENFALPTCPAFFNIFHPYDPVAYRIESLINPNLANAPPVLIPHHKGRKRMHLELKETMARVGTDLKNRLMDSMKSTWNSFYQFNLFNRQANKNFEAEVDKVIEQQLEEQEEIQSIKSDSNLEQQVQTDIPVGILNNGRRIDYVLQEAPFEFFNEYIFALTSHVCYWESEDTMLMMLKEIYSSLGITTDKQVPQQTNNLEHRTSSSISTTSNENNLPIDPIRPVVYNPNHGPPPKSGFVRKT